LLGPEIKSGLIHIPHAGVSITVLASSVCLGTLEKDVFEFGKDLVPGILEAGKAFVHDVGSGETIFKNGLHLNPKSELEKKIVDPTLKQYKATYGKGGGSFWENFYKHPLGPLLDVATVASGGAGAVGKGGQLALKAEAEGTLARKAASIRSLTRDPVEAHGLATSPSRFLVASRTDRWSRAARSSLIRSRPGRRRSTGSMALVPPVGISIRRTTTSSSKSPGLFEGLLALLRIHSRI
jgi:hypothetical protein